MTSPFDLPNHVLAARTTPISGLAAGGRAWTTHLLTTLSGAMTATVLTMPMVGGITVPERTSAPFVWPVGASTRSASEAASSRAVVSTASMVRNLRETSGLTWDQIGRLLGVSRRAVHLWAAGGRVNARHLERLAALQRMVDGLPASTSERRRAMIFEPRGPRPSIFDSYVRQFANDKGVVAGTPFTPDELLDARYDLPGSD